MAAADDREAAPAIDSNGDGGRARETFERTCESASHCALAVSSSRFVYVPRSDLVLRKSTYGLMPHR